MQEEKKRKKQEFWGASEDKVLSSPLDFLG